MKCEKCNVSVSGTAKRCPLCQGDLQGVPNEDEQVYPIVPLNKSRRLFLSIMGFVSVVICVICFTINLSLPGRWWSLFVFGGILSFWVSFSLVVKNRGNIHKAIVWQVALISSIAVIWDLVTGFHNWSVDFVIPILCTVAMLAMAVIGKVMKLEINDYMIYLVLDAILGVLSLILILCGVVNFILPSAICFASSVISLAALFIFEGRAMVSEIKRKVHL